MSKTKEFFLDKRKYGYPMEKNHNWKGGKVIMRGYLYILKPEHPRRGYGNYIKNVDLIAERSLGRILKKSGTRIAHKKDEVVHHINGDKLDDRNENLLISTLSYHLWLHSKTRTRGKDGRFIKEIESDSVQRKLF